MNREMLALIFDKNNPSLFQGHTLSSVYDLPAYGFDQSKDVVVDLEEFGYDDAFKHSLMIYEGMEFRFQILMIDLASFIIDYLFDKVIYYPKAIPAFELSIPVDQAQLCIHIFKDMNDNTEHGIFSVNASSDYADVCSSRDFQFQRTLLLEEYDCFDEIFFQIFRSLMKSQLIRSQEPLLQFFSSALAGRVSYNYDCVYQGVA